MSNVLLVSGGLDSLLCAKEYPSAKKLFINYGQPYAKQEKKACDALFGKDYEVIELKGIKYKSTDGVFIPARNLMLASIAVRYGTTIIMGGMKDDNVEDKNFDAFRRMSEILTSQSRNRIEVISPFWNTTKAEAINRYLCKGNDPALLLKTFSCYEPVGNKACFNCPACFRWSIALNANEVKVPLPSDKMINLYLKKLHTYDKNRISNLLRILIQTKYVYEVDIDGVLTNETQGWDFKSRTPFVHNIKRLKQLFRHGIIILNTARLEIDREVTVEWLKTHKIPYHSLLMEKTPASVRIDDISIPSF